MPRRAHVILPNTPLHIIQRGNNRQACFFAEDDYRLRGRLNIQVHHSPQQPKKRALAKRLGY